MRAPVFLVLLAGCGVLDGPGDLPALATLHLFVKAAPEANVPSQAALVWYDGATSIAVAADSLLLTSPYNFDVDVVALPPVSTLTTVGARRVAIGQLVFYASASSGAPVLDSGETIVGAPMNAQLLYLEGAAVDPSEADPASLLIAGAQPGFNWLSVPPGSPCTPVALPVSSTIDFGFEPGEPQDAPQLCSAPAVVPACATMPGLQLPSCEMRRTLARIFVRVTTRGTMPSVTKPAAPARDTHPVLLRMKPAARRPAGIAALSSAILALGLCGTAAARPDLDLELGNSFDAPIGGKAYSQLVDTSYTASLRFSANFKVAHDVSIGPCIEADGQPVNSDEGIFNSASTGPPGPHRNATLARGRGLAGVKLVVRASHIELWVRVQAGVDSIDGTVTQPAVAKTMTAAAIPAGPTVNVHSTVATFDPEVALVVPISRAFIGIALSTPVAFNHKIAPVYANTPATPPATPVAQPATSKGDAIDLQLGLIAGVRL